jgi:hypothetical protein
MQDRLHQMILPHPPHKEKHHPWSSCCMDSLGRSTQ